MKVPSPREKRKAPRSRVRVWCTGGGEVLYIDYDDESRKLARTPEKRKVRYTRCSVCDQRFEVENFECSDPGCVHHRVPRHKAY